MEKKRMEGERKGEGEGEWNLGGQFELLALVGLTPLIFYTFG